MHEFESSITNEEIMRLSLFPEILGGLSHELAQPLNAITLACEVMRLKIGRADLPETEKEFFDVRLNGVKNQVTRAVSLLDHFRHLFSEQTQQDGQTDICKSMERVIELVGQQLSARGINLVFEKHEVGVYSKLPRGFVEMAVAHCLVYIRNRIDFVKKHAADDSSRNLSYNLSIKVFPLDSGSRIEFKYDEHGGPELTNSSIGDSNSPALRSAVYSIGKHGGTLELETGLVRLVLP